MVIMIRWNQGIEGCSSEPSKPIINSNNIIFSHRVPSGGTGSGHKWLTKEAALKDHVHRSSSDDELPFASLKVSISELFTAHDYCVQVYAD